jgi:hypothetical protein
MDSLRERPGSSGPALAHDLTGLPARVGSQNRKGLQGFLVKTAGSSFKFLLLASIAKARYRIVLQILLYSNRPRWTKPNS